MAYYTFRTVHLTLIAKALRDSGLSQANKTIASRALVKLFQENNPHCDVKQFRAILTGGTDGEEV